MLCLTLVAFNNYTHTFNNCTVAHCSLIKHNLTCKATNLIAATNTKRKTEEKKKKQEYTYIHYKCVEFICCQAFR